MSDPALFRRNAAVLALLATAVLSALAVVTQPSFPDGAAQRIAAIAEAGGSAKISATAFTLAQLPFAVGILGVAHLLRGRTPLLSNLSATLGLVGAFGHAVFGGVALSMLSMAGRPEHHVLFGEVLTDIESGPAVVFMAMGLLGTVVALVLLAVALWRAHLGPRWLPAVLVGFVVIEFAGSGLTEWASYASIALYLLAFAALAATVARTPRAAWTTLPTEDAARPTAASA